MKDFFKNFKSYSFWVSFSGALIILLNALGRAFGFSIENQIVEDCIMSVAGVLVVLGIVTKDNSGLDNDDNGDDSGDDKENVDGDDENVDEGKNVDE